MAGTVQPTHSLLTSRKAIKHYPQGHGRLLSLSQVAKAMVKFAVYVIWKDIN